MVHNQHKLLCRSIVTFDSSIGTITNTRGLGRREFAFAFRRFGCLRTDTPASATGAPKREFSIDSRSFHARARMANMHCEIYNFTSFSSSWGSKSVTPKDLARHNIDRQLKDCGWIIQNMADMNIMAGIGVAVREFQLTTGEADYGLYIDGKVAGVIEAKKEGATLVGVETQTDCQPRHPIQRHRGRSRRRSIGRNRNCERQGASRRFVAPPIPAASASPLTQSAAPRNPAASRASGDRQIHARPTADLQF